MPHILKQEIIEEINNPADRKLIGEELNLTDQSIGNHIRRNSPNSPLLLIGSLMVISKLTKVSIQDLIQSVKPKK